MHYIKLMKSVFIAVISWSAFSAHGIEASNYTNTGEFAGDTLNIRISGSDAVDEALLGHTLSICQANTLHRYSISNNFVYYCSPKPAIVPAPRTKLAVYKYSVGGSGFGVGPINSDVASSGAVLNSAGNQLPFLQLDKLKLNCAGANATTATKTFSAALGNFSDVTCAASVAPASISALATTYIGMSDVEASFFNSRLA
jgi:hypothetical protein